MNLQQNGSVEATIARLTNDSREPKEEGEDKIDDELIAANPSLEEYCQRRDEEGEHIEKEVVLPSPGVCQLTVLVPFRRWKWIWQGPRETECHSRQRHYVRLARPALEENMLTSTLIC
jgi:hypothetical protein